MSDVNLTEFVTVFHPETKGVAEVTREGLEKVWAAKGWQLASDSDLSKLSQDELEAAADAVGADVTGAKTKAEAAKRVKEAAGGND